MFDNNICLNCLLYNYFTEDQLESYQDGDIEVLTTDGDEVCECCGELGPIVTYYGPSSEEEDEDDDEEEYEEDYDDRGTELIDTYAPMNGVDFRNTENF